MSHCNDEDVCHAAMMGVGVAYGGGVCHAAVMMVCVILPW